MARGSRARSGTRRRAAGGQAGAQGNPPIEPRRTGRRRAPKRTWGEAPGAEQDSRPSREGSSRGEETTRGRARRRQGVTPRAAGRRQGRAPSRGPRGRRAEASDPGEGDPSPFETSGSDEGSPPARAVGNEGTGEESVSVSSHLLSALLEKLEEGPRKRGRSRHEDTRGAMSAEGTRSSSESEERSQRARADRRAKKRCKRRRGSRAASASEEADDDSSHWGECPVPRHRWSRPRGPRGRVRAVKHKSHKSHSTWRSRTAAQVWRRGRKRGMTKRGRKRRDPSRDSSESTTTESTDTSTVDSDNPFAPGLPDTPLSMHMSQALKRKIWRGAYVDIFKILLPKKSKKDKDKEGKKGAVESKEVKMDKGILSWAYAFLAYHSVVVEDDVHKTHELILYMNMILRAYQEFGGEAWKQYDEDFRRFAAHNRHWPWDMRHNDLWLQATQQPATPASGRTPTGHLLLSQGREATLPRPGAVSGTQGSSQRGATSSPFRIPPYCYEYGARGACARPACRFRHACALCNGRHPISACYRGRGGGGNKAAVGQAKAQVPGAQGKGANPH